MGRRHHCRHPRNERGTHPKIICGTHQAGKRKIQSKQKEIKFLPKRHNMSWTHNFTRRSQTQQGKNTRKEQSRTPNQHQNPKVFPGGNLTLRKVHTQPL